MGQKTVWDRFVNLPPEAQKQGRDFIAFLQARYASTHLLKKAKRTKLANEAFIGIWRNREDLKDSGAWVRSIR